MPKSRTDHSSVCRPHEHAVVAEAAAHALRRPPINRSHTGTTTPVQSFQFRVIQQLLHINIRATVTAPSCMLLLLQLLRGCAGAGGCVGQPAAAAAESAGVDEQLGTAAAVAESQPWCAQQLLVCASLLRVSTVRYPH